VETIARETGAADLREYVAALRRAAAQPASARSGSGAGDVDAQRYLAPPAAPDAGGTATGGGETEGSARADRRLLRVYAAAGQAILHTHPEDPERDVALAFRSSPYGAISHSHAANNDFILHVAGRALALPSGYYAGYGSDHHTHWQWHAKAHNCVTLSDAPQLMRSHDSAGAVENAFEDERLVYFRGNADASYRDRALRCRRHVLFLKTASAFVLADEFVARPGVASALQWNLHSWAPFVIDAGGRRFTTERDGRVLHGHVMYHANGFFSSSAGWDPPPLAREGVVWPPQYHLRFTCSGLAARRNLGVVLCPEHAGLRPAEVRTEGDAAAERAWIGGALVLLGQGAPIEHDGWRTDALLLAVVDGARYEIADGGVRAAAARGA